MMLLVFGAAVVLVVVASVVLVVAPLRRPERPLRDAWGAEADDAEDEAPDGRRAERVAQIEREVQALRAVAAAPAPAPVGRGHCSLLALVRRVRGAPGCLRRLPRCPAPYGPDGPYGVTAAVLPPGQGGMIRRRLAAVVLLLALGALCGALASGRPARAEGEGEAGGIQGTLLNATTGLPAAGGAVTLYVQGGGPGGGRGVKPASRRGAGGAQAGAPGVEARETVADGEGRFAFAGAGAGARYQLTAVHQGVAYQTPVFALGELPAPLELRVYDVTGRDPGLRTERVLLTFGAVDAGRQEVAVTQLQTLVNPSPAAYRPETTGDPMGLLRFGLPPQATQLRPTLGLSPESLIQVDRGFASSDPVLPGEQEYAFAYRFPYVAPVYAFSLALPYGAASVRVLVPAGPGLGPGRRRPRSGPSGGGGRGAPALPRLGRGPGAPRGAPAGGAAQPPPAPPVARRA